MLLRFSGRRDNQKLYLWTFSLFLKKQLPTLDYFVHLQCSK